MHLAIRPTPCTIGQVYLLVYIYNTVEKQYNYVYGFR